jgi:putative SOS response-associated peptidase YedK
MPSPPKYGSAPITNIRNTKSPHWRQWLKPENRCLVPATSFCEWTDASPKVTHWFALDERRPLFWFAGIWCAWKGVRKKQDGEHLLFGFLTTEANDVVRPIHAKAMPVILRSAEEAERWMTAPAPDALALQQPLRADALRIVARGDKRDGIAA